MRNVIATIANTSQRHEVPSIAFAKACVDIDLVWLWPVGIEFPASRTVPAGYSPTSVGNSQERLSSETPLLSCTYHIQIKSRFSSSVVRTIRKWLANNTSTSPKTHIQLIVTYCPSSLTWYQILRLTKLWM